VCGLFFLFLGAISMPLQAQKKPDIDVDALILDLLPNPDGESFSDELLNDIVDVLYQLYQHPLNLNQAQRSELENLYVLSPYQINEFLKYRSKMGKLLSIYELQAIPGFDLTTIRRLKPFIIVSETVITKDARSLWRRIQEGDPTHYLILRNNQFLETKRGYTPADTNSRGLPNARYLGSPQQYFVRYRLSQTGDYSFGFTLEKDPGETIEWNPAQRYYGFDFVSFHAMLENQGRFKRILIGDYQLGIGQNLLLTAGFALGKGSETINTVRRNDWGVRPYTSTLESGFFRGAAVTYELMPRLELTGFYSRVRRDANVQERLIAIADSLSDGVSFETEFSSENFIESLQITGLHRTPSERAARQTILEENFGGHLNYKNRSENLSVGATFLATRYGIPLQRVERNYNRLEFNGQQNLNVGLNFNYYWQNFTFFGEAARSQSGGVGVVGGFLSSLSPKIDWAMLVRSYDPNFHSLYGSAFGEGSRNINERGIYTGLKVRPLPKMELSFFYDTFTFPFLRFNAAAPSQGSGYFARVTYRPQRGTELFVQFRDETKEINQRNNTAITRLITPFVRQDLIFSINMTTAQDLVLKSRVQFNRQEQEGFYSEGFMIFQDIAKSFGKLRLDARVAIFDDNTRRRADNTLSATFIYVYEKNVLWAPTLVRYSGAGYRYVLLAKYKLTRNIDFWARWAQTFRTDTDRIGTGLEQVDGNVLSQLTFQLKFDF
jgi:hypothetical protein